VSRHPMPPFFDRCVGPFAQSTCGRCGVYARPWWTELLLSSAYEIERERVPICSTVAIFDQLKKLRGVYSMRVGQYLDDTAALNTFLLFDLYCAGRSICHHRAVVTPCL
jgi:hypothetical protein